MTAFLNSVVRISNENDNLSFNISSINSGFTKCFANIKVALIILMKLTEPKELQFLS